ncbi:predicted protein [Nematostella vectensis]|uniref:Tyrosine-protein phosphatase domain-containing protein n=1 Tax=Nematostella vectensis TaxID=45351 RepID=A7SZ84_NEMVE|nr:predicted protein [Nematostella vectensis]|eukprot:XP_001623076.1 predicted protein [Nematostella vectensis]
MEGTMETVELFGDSTLQLKYQSAASKLSVRLAFFSRFRFPFKGEDGRRLQTTNRSAVQGNDFSYTNPTTVSFGILVNEATTTVSITNDVIYEDSEEFYINITGGAAPKALCYTNQFAVITITDDDQGRSLQTTNRSAVQGNDFSYTNPTTVSFAELVNEAATTVSITNDVIYEDSEEFYINITGGGAPKALCYTNQFAVITITDDDQAVIGFQGDVVRFLNESVGSINVTIENTGSTKLPINVRYAVFKTLSHTLQVCSILDFGSYIAATIGFTSSSVTVAENAGNLSLPLTVKSGILGIPIEITFAITNISASSSRDHRLHYSSVTFTQEEPSQHATVTIINDATLENTESFNITATTTSPHVTLNYSSVTVTITDHGDKVTFGFVNKTVSVAESEGNITLLVRKTGNTSIPLDLGISTVNLNASAPGDFTHKEIADTFAVNEDLKSYTFAIHDDHVTEGTECFIVRLNVSRANVLVDPRDAAVCITDNDRVSISFVYLNITVEEQKGRVTVPMRKTGLAEVPVSVRLIEVQSMVWTAMIKADIRDFKDDIITFAPEQTEVSANITIVTDSIAESDELFSISFTPVDPTKAVVNTTRDTCVVRITDEYDNEEALKAKQQKEKEEKETSRILQIVLIVCTVVLAVMLIAIIIAAVCLCRLEPQFGPEYVCKRPVFRSLRTRYTRNFHQCADLKMDKLSGFGIADVPHTLKEVQSMVWTAMIKADIRDFKDDIITFAPEQTEVSANITIVTDSIAESDELFSISFTPVDPTKAVVNTTRDTCVVRITDEYDNEEALKAKQQKEKEEKETSRILQIILIVCTVVLAVTLIAIIIAAVCLCRLGQFLRIREILSLEKAEDECVLPGHLTRQQVRTIRPSHTPTGAYYQTISHANGCVLPDHLTRKQVHTTRPSHAPTGAYYQTISCTNKCVLPDHLTRQQVRTTRPSHTPTGAYYQTISYANRCALPDQLIHQQVRTTRPSHTPTGVYYQTNSYANRCVLPDHLTCQQVRTTRQSHTPTCAYYQTISYANKCVLPDHFIGQQVRTTRPSHTPTGAYYQTISYANRCVLPDHLTRQQVRTTRPSHTPTGAYYQTISHANRCVLPDQLIRQQVRTTRPSHMPTGAYYQTISYANRCVLPEHLTRQQVRTTRPFHMPTGAYYQTISYANRCVLPDNLIRQQVRTTRPSHTPTGAYYQTISYANRCVLPDHLIRQQVRTTRPSHTPTGAYYQTISHANRCVLPDHLIGQQVRTTRPSHTPTGAYYQTNSYANRCVLPDHLTRQQVRTTRPSHTPTGAYYQTISHANRCVLTEHLTCQRVRYYHTISHANRCVLSDNLIRQQVRTTRPSHTPTGAYYQTISHANRCVLPDNLTRQQVRTTRPSHRPTGAYYQTISYANRCVLPDHLTRQQVRTTRPSHTPTGAYYQTISYANRCVLPDHLIRQQVRTTRPSHTPTGAYYQTISYANRCVLPDHLIRQQVRTTRPSHTPTGAYYQTISHANRCVLPDQLTRQQVRTTRHLRRQRVCTTRPSHMPTGAYHQTISYANRCVPPDQLIRQQVRTARQSHTPTGAYYQTISHANRCVLPDHLIRQQVRTTRPTHTPTGAYCQTISHANRCIYRPSHTPTGAYYRLSHTPTGAYYQTISHANSAGVGRTGAFLVMDAMLRQAKKQKTVDIFNYVKAIREDRPHMVQTSEQYVFIHLAVLEALVCGSTDIPADNMKAAMARLSKLRTPGNVSGYEAEFQV